MMVLTATCNLQPATCVTVVKSVSVSIFFCLPNACLRCILPALGLLGEPDGSCFVADTIIEKRRTSLPCSGLLSLLQ